METSIKYKKYRPIPKRRQVELLACQLQTGQLHLHNGPNLQTYCDQSINVIPGDQWKAEPRQHGFCSKKCCDIQLIELISQISSLMDQERRWTFVSRALTKLSIKLIMRSLFISWKKLISAVRDPTGFKISITTSHRVVAIGSKITSGIPQSLVIRPTCTSMTSRTE